ncbi:MAG: molecular chaperone HtpG [Pseudomonadota bacterium]
MVEANKKQDINTETKSFETDVSRLLDIVANALYSNRDVFLRELISNAADACDRMRYELLQNSKIVKSQPQFQIRLTPDNNDLSLTITDNGIGMNKDDLIDNLGTIARSGTSKILETLQESGQEKDMNLIGQFGVGFYASFMVAQKVTVVSRKAGDDQSWFWESDGKTGFTIREASDEERKKLLNDHGTSITLFMKKDAIDYLLQDSIMRIVLAYSDHIEIPIFLDDQNQKNEEEKEEQPINAASALWTRPKNEITEDQYREFYHHIGNVFDDPTLTLHWTAEGKIEYTGLLFIPSMRPWDIYDPERKNALRLYVKRVFISDSLKTLLFPWLRFVRGIIDTQDLPLNISREMLQTNPIVHKIRNGITKKILSEIDTLSRKDEDAFLTLWGQFGAMIKEGLYDATEHRDNIFKICRFYSTHDVAKPTSLSDYIERMKDGQDKIFYMAGEKIDSLRNSPQLEGFQSRGVEVLLLTDTVDEFWLQQVSEYEGKTFQSITKGNIDLDHFEPQDEKSENDKKEEKKKEIEQYAHLKDVLHEKLSDQISFVRLSNRLTESPVCLVADDKGVDMHMEKVLRIHQKYEPDAKPVLEINPDHALIQKLGELSQDKDKNEEVLKDSAYLLMDQALIIQGDTPSDPAGFAKRMAKFMEKGLL